MNIFVWLNNRVVLVCSDVLPPIYELLLGGKVYIGAREEPVSLKR